MKSDLGQMRYLSVLPAGGEGYEGMDDVAVLSLDTMSLALTIIEEIGVDRFTSRLFRARLLEYLKGMKA